MSPAGSGSSTPTMSAPTQVDDSRVRSALSNGVKFRITTGNGKWECTLLDRATHERQKALRNDSSSSLNSNASETSTSH